MDTSTTRSATDERAEYIAGPRAFADLLERDPGLPLPDQGDLKW